MRKPKKEIHLTSYEELLGIEDNQENSVDKITEIPIDCLYGFKNHPFHAVSYTHLKYSSQSRGQTSRYENHSTGH